MTDTTRHTFLSPAIWLFTCLLTLFGPSANALMQDISSDTAVISRLYDITGKETNSDSAIRGYERLLKLSLEANFTEKTKGIYLKLGEKYAIRGDYVTSLKYMNESLKFSSWEVDIASCYSHMGWIYFTMGDYVTASENFYSALDNLKRMKKRSPREAPEYCINYRFLGLIHYKLHQNEKALYYLNLGEDIARQNKKPNFIAIILTSKGDFYNDIEQPDSAKKYYTHALEMARQYGLRAIEAEANSGVGKSLVKSGMYKEALGYLRLAISMDKTLDKNASIEASYYLGEALYHLGSYKEAESILVAALRQATIEKSYDNIIHGYKVLTEVYKTTSQYQKALDCMDSLGAVKDSMVSAQKTKDINLLDIKFQTVEKDRQIALQQSKIARKDTWILGISSGVVLLLVISVAIYLNTLHKQRMNAAHLKTIEKENKIEVLKAVVQGGDKERTHIARELHDGVGGMVSAAMMRFSALGSENEEIPRMASYREAMKILNEVGDEIRKTAHNLMPNALLKQNLPEAVQTFCNSVQANGDLHINFQCMGSFDNLAQPYKLNLYRIVQELIKNVIRHAHATQAVVQLLLNENVLIVSVEDNGVGFNINDVKEGMGLHNTQTRASSLDGHFVVDSTPGKGTSVFIEFKNPMNI